MTLPHTWHGADSGSVIVFANSLGATSWSWHHQIAALETRCRLLTFELPGHFVADEQEPFGFGDMVEQFAALLDELDLTAVTVCGVSLGGALGVALAASRPDLVSRLVVVNAPIRQPSRAFWIERAEHVEADGLERLGGALTERWLSVGAQAGTDAQELRRQFLGLPVQGYANACRALAELDVTAHCDVIVADTLVVSAADDLAVAPENSAELAERITGARLRSVPEAAHLLPIDRPDHFSALLEDFIASRESGAAHA